MKVLEYLTALNNSRGIRNNLKSFGQKNTWSIFSTFKEVRQD
jgi:hypothetical protein